MNEIKALLKYLICEYWYQLRYWFLIINILLFSLLSLTSFGHRYFLRRSY